MAMVEPIPMPTEINPHSDHLLMAWFSPAYPVGAFSYSHGLEFEIESGRVTAPASLSAWITSILKHGSGRNDATLLALAYHANEHQISEIADLAQAICASRERALETMEMGRSFGRITAEVNKLELPHLPYPVAVGHAASQCHLPLEQVLAKYLHAMAQNLISVGVRLIPIGQTDGQKILTGLFSLIDEVKIEAIKADELDLGSCCVLADIAAMRHETMTTRIFRT